MVFPQSNTIFDFSQTHGMNTNFQQFPASGHLVDDITCLRQRLEYFERHIQTRNQEVKNVYNQALTKVLEAEKALSHFAEVFTNSK